MEVIDMVRTCRAVTVGATRRKRRQISRRQARREPERRSRRHRRRGP